MIVHIIPGKSQMSGKYHGVAYSGTIINSCDGYGFVVALHSPVDLGYRVEDKEIYISVQDMHPGLHTITT